MARANHFLSWKIFQHSFFCFNNKYVTKGVDIISSVKEFEIKWEYIEYYNSPSIEREFDSNFFFFGILSVLK